MTRPETRPAITGPDVPSAPFPIRVRGPVVRGFGRGSKELGIPTANIPLSGLSIGGHDDLESGIYYGWCALDTSTVTSTPAEPPSSTSSLTTPSSRPLEPSSNHAVADLAPPSSPSDTPSGTTTPQIYPTVLSIGYNPYYANTTRSIEIHILHDFGADFYGAQLSLLILGYIRPEYDYVSKEALVEDIREDIRVARRGLEREAYRAWKGDGWLGGVGEREGEGEGEGERVVG